MTEFDLKTLLKEAVQEGVREYLAAAASSSPVGAGTSSPPSPLPAELSPAAVRTMARCAAKAVSDALQSGDLRGRKEKVIDRRTREAGDGSRKIPSYIWKIAPDDAWDWIRRKNANKSRSG
jgi:hypothetical protein